MKDYYSKNSEAFIKDTFNCDMSEQYRFFEQYLPKDSKTILDIGFGSGRDSLYFSKKYEVFSIDPTKEFCDNATKLGLKNVYQMTAQNMQFENQFDGIWACASLLHIPSLELNNAFKKCGRALKNGGVMYASFKYGEFEGARGDREYVDLTEESVINYLVNTKLKLIVHSITEDVRPNRTEKWLNLILEKYEKI